MSGILDDLEALRDDCRGLQDMRAIHEAAQAAYRNVADDLDAIIRKARAGAVPCLCDPPYSATDTNCPLCFPAPTGGEPAGLRRLIVKGTGGVFLEGTVEKTESDYYVYRAEDVDALLPLAQAEGGLRGRIETLVAEYERAGQGDQAPCYALRSALRASPLPSPDRGALRDAFVAGMEHPIAYFDPKGMKKFREDFRSEAARRYPGPAAEAKP